MSPPVAVPRSPDHFFLLGFCRTATKRLILERLAYKGPAAASSALQCRRRDRLSCLPFWTPGHVFDIDTLLLFLAAALLVAITPGPGIFCVAARMLAEGRLEGLASSIGLGLGGLVHVAAGAVGVSALVMASAEAFTILKIIGVAYLVWLGLKAWREARVHLPTNLRTTGWRQAFHERIIVEALNPKTAAFFLAFIPQFVDPSRDGARSVRTSCWAVIACSVV
jgi:threonine/homoserine/homoserine lactone efflux protein